MSAGRWLQCPSCSSIYLSINEPQGPVSAIFSHSHSNTIDCPPSFAREKSIHVSSITATGMGGTYVAAARRLKSVSRSFRRPWSQHRLNSHAQFTLFLSSVAFYKVKNENKNNTLVMTFCAYRKPLISLSHAADKLADNTGAKNSDKGAQLKRRQCPQTHVFNIKLSGEASTTFYRCTKGYFFWLKRKSIPSNSQHWS